jgi:hypothetical protein
MNWSIKSNNCRNIWLEFDSRQVQWYLLLHRVRTGSQPPIQWAPGALSLTVKRPEREADHSHPSSAEFTNAWSYTSTSQYASMVWCLVKAQGRINIARGFAHRLVDRQQNTITRFWTSLHWACYATQLVGSVMTQTTVHVMLNRFLSFTALYLGYWHLLGSAFLFV